MSSSVNTIAEIPLVSGGTCAVSVEASGRVSVTFENPLLDEPAAAPLEITGAEALELAREILAGRIAPTTAHSIKLAAAVLVMLRASA